MKDRVDFYRERKVKLIINVFNISFNFKWTEFFMIKLVTKSYRFNISL
jgi:hypothetical protein